MKPELDFVLWRGGMGRSTARLETPEGVAHMRRRIERFDLLQPEAYLNLSPDLEGQDALTHFSEYGVWEPHRRFVSDKGLAAYLGALSQAPLPGVELPSAERLAAGLGKARGLDLAIHVNSASRWFVRALGEELVAGFQSLGLRAALLDEHADRQAARTRLFVAPHEFFTLGSGAEWATLEMLSAALMYSTEPLEAPQFRAAVPYLLACAGVATPHPQTCAMLRRAGVPAMLHLPSGPQAAEQAAPPDHPLVRGLARAVKRYEAGEDLWAERPLDLAFLGTETAVRDEFFSANAALFAELSCVIQLTRWYGPPQAQQPGDTRAALQRYLGRRAKIVLNLPEEELVSVDWRRMILGGFAQRALVVSTPCLPHPLFKPGVHYLEESWRRLPQLIEWLLRTPEGRLTAERVRQQAYVALREHAAPRSMAAALATFMAEQAA